MKRLFCVILIITLTALFSITCFAAESEEENFVVEAGGVQEYAENEKNVTEASPGFFERIGEYITSGRIFQLLGWVAALIMICVLKSVKKLCNAVFLKVSGAMKTGASAAEKLEVNTNASMKKLEEKMDSINDMRNELEKIKVAIVDLADIFYYQALEQEENIGKQRSKCRNQYTSNEADIVRHYIQNKIHFQTTDYSCYKL